MDARKTGDPIAIGQASKQVIALALVEMAKFRLDQKAYDEAIRLCVESLEFEDTAETRVEVAILSLYAKKPSDAVKQATAATQLDPQNSLAWTIKGEALLRSRNYDGAAKALSIALEVKRGAQSLYGLGVAQLGMGETQRAAETFSQFLALTGDFGWSRVLVGRAYQEQALQQEAEMEFQKALLLDPATPNAHYFWALTLMRANTWNPNAEVYSHLRAELHLNPRHFEANYVLGFLASTARNYKESDRYLHLASQVKPLVPETWVLLGLNAQKRGANRIAEAYFRKAIALAKNLDPREHFEVRKAYTGLGRLLMASGRAADPLRRMFLSPILVACLPSLGCRKEILCPSQKHFQRREMQLLPRPALKKKQKNIWERFLGRLSMTLPLRRHCKRNIKRHSTITGMRRNGIPRFPACSAISASRLILRVSLRTRVVFSRKLSRRAPPMLTREQSLD